MFMTTMIRKNDLFNGVVTQTQSTTKNLPNRSDFLFIYMTREFSDTVVFKVRSYPLVSYNVVS